MKRRLFIAINLPDKTKKRLIEWQQKISAQFSENPKAIKWVRKDNLHITLLFIGYVTDDEMYEICKAAREVAEKHDSFTISLENIILAPPKKTPRMFWLQGQKSQELGNLQGDLQEKIEQRTGGRHAFRPHVTLARFGSGVLKSLSGEINEPFPAQIPVETIEIMQSNLKRSGAEYSVLESIELR